MGVLATLVVGLCVAHTALAQPEPPGPRPPGAPVTPQVVTPSLGVNPDQAGATPHWTITVGAQYCGGYRIGDGVYVSPEAPLAIPNPLPDGSVLFAGQPASVAWVNGALRVSPGEGLAQSMICMAGDRPLTVELLPEAGFGLPTDAGEYAVDVWTGVNPTPMNFVLSVPAADQTPPAG
jgi:hypothetical protein